MFWVSDGHLRGSHGAKPTITRVACRVALCQSLVAMLATQAGGNTPLPIYDGARPVQGLREKHRAGACVDLATNAAALYGARHDAVQLLPGHAGGVV